MKILLILSLCLISTLSYSSQSAITDKGENVILNDDGTWRYSKNSQNAQVSSKKVAFNKGSFKKPKKSTFQIKSTINNASYFINTKKWKFKKESADTAKEYMFNFKRGDVYGMAINEEIPMSLDTLGDAAFTNAKNAATDMKIVKREYRKVNGKKVLFMEMSGIISGINFTYVGYYYSDSKGSSQFLCYTSTNLVNKYRKDIMGMLNGFVIRK